MRNLAWILLEDIGILHMPHRNGNVDSTRKHFPVDLAIEVTLTHEPSRWWHRSRRVPSAYVSYACLRMRSYICVTCTLTTFCSHAVLRHPARLRLSSANEFRFSSKLWGATWNFTDAPFLRIATCTHVAIEGTRAEGSNAESDMSEMSKPHVYPRVFVIVAGDR